MWISWRGAGWLAGAIPIVMIFVSISLSQGRDHLVRGLIYSVDFFVSSASVWIIGRALNHRPIIPWIRPTESQQMQELDEEEEHQFFSLPMELWSTFYLVGAACALLYAFELVT